MAPTIYMTIVVSLIGVLDPEVRQQYLINFKRVFTVCKAIPVKILAEPLLKLYSQSDFKIQPFDFEFLTFIAGHKKLDTPCALI